MSEDSASRLRAVGDGEDALKVHPMPAGTRLASFDYWQVHQHALAGSRFWAVATNEEVGAAMRLWNSAYRDQDPGGTLPCDDIELATIARYGTDMAGWQRVRRMVLRGWEPVRIVDASGAAVGVRFAHPMVTDIALVLHGLKDRARQRTASSRLSMQRSRIREKLRDLGFTDLADTGAAIIALSAWLEARGLIVTVENVREAAWRFESGKLS